MAEQNKEPEKRTVGYDFMHGGVAGVKYVRRERAEVGQVYEIVRAGIERDPHYGNEITGVGVRTMPEIRDLGIIEVWDDARATPEQVQRAKESALASKANHAASTSLNDADGVDAAGLGQR